MESDNPYAFKSNPFKILDVSIEMDDETIRKRYLELIKQFSPEHHPEKFQEIRAAYETIKAMDDRLNYWLFDFGSESTIETILEELACSSERPRVGLSTLVRVIKAN